jgi:hypothetical protein
LVRVNGDGEEGSAAVNLADDQSHVIRVLLNGKPVLSVDFDSQGTDCFLGSGPERLLSIQDFLQLVTRLEDDGGHDYERLLGRTSAKPADRQL